MPKQSLENAITELNNLVEKMESEQLTIEESLSFFEQGIKLTKFCQKNLKEAEQKVQCLTDKSGDFKDYEQED